MADSLRRQGKTVKTLLPYLWPRDNTEIRVRVVLAMAALAAAKVANVWVPLFYKDAVDVLSGEGVGDTAATAALAVPVVPAGRSGRVAGSFAFRSPVFR